MQQPIEEHLLDCVSAKELLKALTTLQNINELPNDQLQLSFSRESHSYFNTAQENKQMNFQLYMAKKNNPSNKKKNTSNNKASTAKQIIKEKKKQVRKSHTPKKLSLLSSQTPQKINLNTTTTNQYKSRSHSPMIKSPLAQCKKQKNIEDDRQNNKQNIKNIKMNDKSKKIMMNKEKKGELYIPIHQRTDKVMREKQQKILKLQKRNITIQQLQQKQCTFKPTINNNWNKTKLCPNSTSTNNLSIRKNCEHSITTSTNILEQSFITMNKSIDNNGTFKNTNGLKQKNYDNQLNISSSSHHRVKEQDNNIKTVRKTKYKNSKFNTLLDLIK